MFCRTGKIHYMSHLYLAISTKLNSVLPKLCSMVNIPATSKLILWEEIKPNMLERIEDTNQPLEHIIEELMDGDIIVFQVVSLSCSSLDMFLIVSCCRWTPELSTGSSCPQRGITSEISSTRLDSITFNNSLCKKLHN